MALIIILILIGTLLIIAELLLIPGIFITGLIGIGTLVYACMQAFELYGQTGGVITLFGIIFLVVLTVVLALRSKAWKKVSLNTNIDSRIDSKPEEKGVVVGQKGVTITRLCPMGKIKVENQFIEATSYEGIIDPGNEVEVVMVDDNKIYVKQL